VEEGEDGVAWIVLPIVDGERVGASRRCMSNRRYNPGSYEKFKSIRELINVSI
jgi:hypothetical protein